jgi:hypothetical protein
VFLPTFSLETATDRDSLGTGTTQTLREGGDEFAAEVGDVWDHAAPNQVRGNRAKLEQVCAGLLKRSRETSTPMLVCSQVWTARGRLDVISRSAARANAAA